MNDNVETPVCLAPWVHSFVNTRGKRNLCCFRDYSLEEVTSSDQLSFDTYWNSEPVRQVRLQMLNGVIPSECYPCSKNIFYNEQPRNFFFDKYTDLKKTVREQTDSQGYTEFKPLFYDYRFSNLCQLACRMCDARSSSRLEKLEVENEKVIDVETMVRPFIEKELLPELLDKVKTGAIDQLYWAGGEPLLAPEHWLVMNAAIEAGHSKSIDVIYNTNLGMLKTPMGDLAQLVSSFQKTVVLASLDGVEELGEFIREGLSWKNFQENIKILRKTPNVQVMLTITLTLPGILEIEKLAQYIVQEQLNYDVHFASANGMHELFTPLILPRPLLERLIKEALIRLSTFEDPRVQSLRDNLKLILTHPTLEERFNDEYDPQFYLHRARYLQREQKENKSLALIYQKHDQELYQWWTRQAPLPQKNKQDTLEIELASDWIAVHLPLLEKKRAAYLYQKNNALVSYFQEHSVDLISQEDWDKIPASSYDLFLLSNEWPDLKSLEKLRGKLRAEGEISLIAPVQSLLNCWLHRNNKQAYLDKTFIYRHFSDQLNKRFPSLSYMAKQRQLPNWFVMLMKLGDLLIPSRWTALHGHYRLKK